MKFKKEVHNSPVQQLVKNISLQAPGRPRCLSLKEAGGGAAGRLLSTLSAGQFFALPLKAAGNIGDSTQKSQRHHPWVDGCTPNNPGI